MLRLLICILATWAIMMFIENVCPSVTAWHAAVSLLMSILICVGCWKAIGK